jgi:predicted amidohydrolase YtcJ
MSERLVLPAITDAHDHVIADAYSGVLRDPSLDRITSKDEALAQIQAECLQRNLDGYEGVVLFRKAIEMGITAEELDAVSQGLSIVLLEPSNHGGVANSSVLSQVRAFAEGKKLRGSIADDGHVSEHYATVAKNMAFSSVEDEELARSLEAVLASRVASGISYVHDMGVRSGRDLKVIAELKRKWESERREPFPITRGYIMHLGEIAADPVEEIQARLESGELTKDDLSWIGIKFLADGTLGSHSAHLTEDYTDLEPDVEFPRGFSTMEIESATDVMKRAADLGIREVAVHAIGDQAIYDSLELAERWQGIAGEQGFDGTRFRIEHFELPLPADDVMKRIKDMGTWVGPQPNFLTDYGYVDRLGEERIAAISPHRTIHEAGVNTMYGTDRMPASPLFAIWCAMNALYANQKLSFDEAIQYFTETPAAFEGRTTKETVVFDARLHELLRDPRNDHEGIALLERAKRGDNVNADIKQLVAELHATART